MFTQMKQYKMKMKFYWVRTLFIVLVCCPVRTPMYGPPLSQSDQRIRSALQSVYNNISLITGWTVYTEKYKARGPDV